MADVLLDLERVSVAYGRSDAVKNLDMSVRSGQVVCLIGANGAGKTTTLRAISGLQRIRQGRITFAGEAIAGLPAHRIAQRGIAHVPEGRQIFAQMTVDENLAIGGWRSRDAAARARARDGILARFPRLAERLGQTAGLLSGGEQQMLAIGRALMSDPRLLLLDEPSMGLAPLFVAEIFRIVAELKAEGRTILLVEQNARAALGIADQAYVLRSGTIELAGPASQVADNPQVVAAYLGG